MKKQFLTGMTAMLLVFGLVGMAGATPVKWDVNGHWYELIAAPNITWTDASAQANDMSGYLATITSAEENAFVFSLGVGSNPIWLGGFQQVDSLEPGGGWQWVSGEAWGEYTNWASGEPNNSTWGQENALVFWNGNGQWNDAPAEWAGYSGGGYVVEYDSAPVPEPATILLLAIGLGSMVGCRKKFMK